MPLPHLGTTVFTFTTEETTSGDIKYIFYFQYLISSGSFSTRQVFHTDKASRYNVKRDTFIEVAGYSGQQMVTLVYDEVLVRKTLENGIH